MLKSMRQGSGDLDLIRENISLREEITLLKEELKVFQNRNKLKLNLNLSQSKSKSKSRTPTYSPMLHKKPNTSSFHQKSTWPK